MRPDVNIFYADLPTYLGAFTVPNPDCTYTILLNSKLSREQHLIAYHHEMKHIENGDYEKQSKADMLELYAHSI